MVIIADPSDWPQVDCVESPSKINSIGCVKVTAEVIEQLLASVTVGV